MELQKIISEVLAVSTLVLMVATVAFPMSVLIAQSAGSRLERVPIALLKRRTRRGLDFLATMHLLHSPA